MHEDSLAEFTVYNKFDWCSRYTHYCGGSDSYEKNAGVATVQEFDAAARHSRRACPYCTTPLTVQHESKGVSSSGTRSTSRIAKICLNCGFWSAETQTDKDRGPMDRWFYHRFGSAVAKRFPIDLPDPPMQELRTFLRNSPTALRNLHPTAFEKLVVECFRSNWKPVEAVHVGRPADGGVDAVLVMADNQRWLIQCKCRRSKSAVEDVQVVRNLLGVLLAERELRGVVVSTADHFSYHAQRLSCLPHLVEKGYEIKLIDYGILKELIQTDLSTRDAIERQRHWVKYFTANNYYEIGCSQKEFETPGSYH